MSHRLEWMDFLRGSCILFVIISHWTMMIGVDNIVFNTIFNFFNNWLSPLRMELLFFLSGLMVKSSLAKGKYKYFKGKIDNILYPYLVWGIIFILLFILKSFFSNTTYSLSDTVLGILFGVKGAIWFLYSLFLFYCITPFLIKINFCYIFLAVCFLKIFFENFNIIDGYGFLYEDQSILSNLYYYLYFYIGAKFFNLNSEFYWQRSIMILSVISFLSVLLISIFWDLEKTSFYYFFPVIISFPVVIFFAKKICTIDNKFVESIKNVGRNSIVYYIIHFYIFMGFTFFIDIFKLNSDFFSFLCLCLCLCLCYVLDIHRGKFPIISLLFSYSIVRKRKNDLEVKNVS